jgi:hypothetical protein
MSGTEYHFILTIQWTPSAGAIGTTTRAGVISVGPDETRDDVFKRLLSATREGAHLAPHVGATPLFFALEPNALGGAR